MPVIYLSPSMQEWNPTVTDRTEEYNMNLIADAMEPYLFSSGIRYVRNTPDMTAALAIQESNAGSFDLHLALHSNAAPEKEAGQRRGTEVYYARGSTWGQKAADIIARNLKQIYPLPDRVQALPTTSLGEVVKTHAPAVLIEFAYHDNLDDALWIEENIQAIARNVVLSLTEYFGIPFVEPQTPQVGYVSTQGGNLNLRRFPSTSAPILARLSNGLPLMIRGAWENWYVVDANGQICYVSADYIRKTDPSIS